MSSASVMLSNHKSAVGGSTAYLTSSWKITNSDMMMSTQLAKGESRNCSRRSRLAGQLLPLALLLVLALPGCSRDAVLLR